MGFPVIHKGVQYTVAAHGRNRISGMAIPDRDDVKNRQNQNKARHHCTPRSNKSAQGIRLIVRKRWNLAGL